MNNLFNLTQEILNKWDESKEKPITTQKNLEKFNFFNLLDLEDLEL